MKSYSMLRNVFQNSWSAFPRLLLMILADATCRLATLALCHVRLLVQLLVRSRAHHSV